MVEEKMLANGSKRRNVHVLYLKKQVKTIKNKMFKIFLPEELIDYTKFLTKL